MVLGAAYFDEWTLVGVVVVVVALLDGVFGWDDGGFGGGGHGCFCLFWVRVFVGVGWLLMGLCWWRCGLVRWVGCLLKSRC
jgi:hypothetical protein